MSGAADTFHSELNYLWQAVREAQDAQSRCEAEGSRAKAGLEHASSRVAHLEKELAGSVERERRLRAETEKLAAAVRENSESLALAASQTEEVRGAAARRAEYEEKLKKKEGEAALLDAEISRLRSETAALRESLKGSEFTIEALKRKISGILALPELTRALDEDSRLSGKQKTVYEYLLDRLEKEKRSSAETAEALAKSGTEISAARESLAAAEKETARLRPALASARQELEALAAAMREASDKAAVSNAEKAALENRIAALSSALGERETALEISAAEAGSLRRELDAAKAETARLREETAAQVLKTEEQRRNFSGAIAQVFDLQDRAAALRTELSAAQEKNASLAAALEKVSGLLREAKNGLALEKETARRAAASVRTLEAEIEALKAKITAAGDYSARLLRAVQERDLLVGALKGDLRRVEALELENENLRRRNVKFTGLIQREQADFAAKVINTLKKAAKDLKTFSLNIPASGRRNLNPAMKNLLASINLLKSWQEYMDCDPPELEDTDLAVFVSVETGKWERAFRQRRISIAAAIAAPLLRARLDPARMRMLFYHLAKNAYERLPRGGSLNVTLKTSQDGRQALLSFEDDGPGFAQETLGRLFAPFNTTGRGKAGIGLAVARRIAEKHGGTLEAYNRKERGALVEVKLPL